jgi:hypothetical protein
LRDPQRVRRRSASGQTRSFAAKLNALYEFGR